MTASPPSGMVALAARVASASRAMARVTGVLIILIMIAVVIDAVLRGIMGIAIWGVLEVGVLLLLALIYLGLPATQANSENFRVSIFAERFPPWVDRIVTWLLLGVQLAVLGILCWTSWRSASGPTRNEKSSTRRLNGPRRTWPNRHGGAR
jgi:TRAP-type C4-dicarboxylate transport system permease small subunit